MLMSVMITIYICAGTGILLIFIGGISGVTLYAQAAGLIKPAYRESSETLWTLFIVGVMTGLFLLVGASLLPTLFPQLFI